MYVLTYVETKFLNLMNKDLSLLLSGNGAKWSFSSQNMASHVLKSVLLVFLAILISRSLQAAMIPTI